jgi:hypothetical protein
MQHFCDVLHVYLHNLDQLKTPELLDNLMSVRTF